MKKLIAIVFGFFAISVLTSLALGADTKALDREEAEKILEAYGYKDVVIGLIVEGFSNTYTAGPNTAMVYAVARNEKGDSERIRQLVFYGEKVGWCIADSLPNQKTRKYEMILYTAKGKKTLTHK